MTNIHLLAPYNLEQMSPGETAAARAHFGLTNVGSVVVDIEPGSLVIPRFRVIPFGAELEAEIIANGSTTVNTFAQHSWIADLFQWVDDLQPLTAPAYRMEDFQSMPEGEYFVKGATNSLKNRGPASSFATSKAEAMAIALQIQHDTWIGSQEIAFRPRQDYRRLGENILGSPVFHERRVFILDGQVLASGFYWDNWSDGASIAFSQAALDEAISAVIERISHRARFIVADMAEYTDGSWGVVELNDGAMSGLSAVNADELWRRFAQVVNARA